MKEMGCYPMHLEGHEASQELLLVPDDHHVADEGQLPLNGILNEHWRDVLTTGCNDQFLKEERRGKKEEREGGKKEEREKGEDGEGKVRRGEGREGEEKWIGKE